MSHHSNHHKMQGKRVSLSRPGGREVLTLTPFEPQTPQAGEVLIKIKAIGVNFADVAVRLGLYESAKTLVGWPITPGFDMAGIVEQVGEVSEETDGSKPVWQVGDRVFGVTFFGAYSTHVTLPSDQLFKLPDDWTFERGAAFSTVHLTAWYALHQLGAVQAGHQVLIHSAAGGVGLALLQLCRAIGAQTIGVVRGAHKVATALEYGAHQVIDKQVSSLWKEVDRLAPEGVDLVLDANGYDTLREGYQRLKPEGRLICYGAATMLKRGGGRPPWLRLAWRYLTRPKLDPLAMTSENRSVMAFNLSFLFHRKALLLEAVEQLMHLNPQLVEQPHISLPLSEVAEAHRLIESGESVGKIILTHHHS